MAESKIYPSRYDYGVKTITHKGVNITTSLHTKIDDLIKKIPQDIDQT